MVNYQSPTQETFNNLQKAFDFFNENLFEGRLPPVHMSVERQRSSHGYFHAEQYQHRVDGDKLHMIAMNPNTMSRDLRDVLGTLVHEMVHLQQEDQGKPPKSGGHNKEWAKMMEAVGLIPSNTGQPGGKKTGRKVTHYIDPDGPFDVYSKKLDVELPYFTNPKVSAAKKKDLSKLKSTCPDCNTNAWSKQGAMLVCGKCNIEMEQEQV